MFNPAHVPPVGDDELLARYVTSRGQFRPSDQTVKQDLFMPHPRRELSVTRHREATEEEIWAVGNDVSMALNKKLYGRADIQASDCNIDPLRVTEKPLENNPNHADIEGWPASKADKKIIALQLAASAHEFIQTPSA